LEVDDILFVNSKFGSPAVNYASYTSDDIKNSFWGIRLDYLKKIKKIIYFISLYYNG